MDSYREFPSEFELPASEVTPSADVAVAIGTDERRMHVRAYNYWVSLLDGRDYPSIEDLEPSDLADFSANSVLLDFTCGQENPATPYIGAAIRQECGLGDQIRHIADVPRRSLLFRLTDHYLEIIANRAPVGFEAEFTNQRGQPICYRGILMPFSSNGDTIDFIYGVINWKLADGVSADGVGATAAVDEPQVAQDDELTLSPDMTFMPDTPEPVMAEESHSEAPTPALPNSEQEVPAPDEPPLLARKRPAFAQPFTRSIDLPDEPGDDVGPITVDSDAALADRLWAAREIAEAVKSADGRSRVALYGALALAYDFAIAAQEHPEDYAELLQESGVKAQTRAPMTPIVKLVFGIEYDKTRLTEFASALSYARRKEVSLGGFQKFIEAQAGGLKALVAAERQAKRPEHKPDAKLEAAKQHLRAVPAVLIGDLGGDEEFALVITRRNSSGVHEAVAVVEDSAMIERAIRRAA